MSTKTMRPPPRRVLSSNKRKEREGSDPLKPSPPSPTKLAKPILTQAGSGKLSDPILSNQLLAGYLAHEFLTKGTLYGQPWDSAGAEPLEQVLSCMESNNVKPSQNDEEAEPTKKGNYQRYVEVSSLFKADGPQLPGVVNPSQLSRFLQM